MYVDKLDGRIDSATFDRLAETGRAEQWRLEDAIQEHTQTYFSEGAQLLELASRCQELFAMQPPEEKRRLLDYVLSNCSYREGTLIPTFQKPFDLPVQTRKLADTIAAGGTLESRSVGKFDT